MKDIIFLITLVSIFFVASAYGKDTKILDIRRHNGICEVRTLIGSQGMVVVGRFIYHGRGEWGAQNQNDLRKNSSRNLGAPPVKGLYNHLSSAGSFFRFNRIDGIYHNPYSIKDISEKSQVPKVALVSEIASQFKASHGVTLFAGSSPVELYGTACHLFWRAMDSDEIITSYGLIPEQYYSKVLDEITAMLFLERVIRPNEEAMDLETLRRTLTSN